MDDSDFLADRLGRWCVQGSDRAIAC